MVPRWFHKYLKMFEKKKLKRMPIRKTWDHAIYYKMSYSLIVILELKSVPEA